MFQCLGPLQFHLPGVVITVDALPYHFTFYFQGSGLPLVFCSTWSSSVHDIHVALEKLQAGAQMLHRMAFHLSDNVVALHQDDSTAKA